MTRIKTEEKRLPFKWEENDGSILLGVPNDVVAENGNMRDGGCMLKFTTSELSIGLEERFALYLFSGDIKEITLQVWKAFLKTEPQRAKEYLEEVLTEIRSLVDEV